MYDKKANPMVHPIVTAIATMLAAKNANISIIERESPIPVISAMPKNIALVNQKTPMLISQVARVFFRSTFCFPSFGSTVPMCNAEANLAPRMLQTLLLIPFIGGTITKINGNALMLPIWESRMSPALSEITAHKTSMG
jgi:hypothetical protein